MRSHSRESLIVIALSVLTLAGCDSGGGGGGTAYVRLLNVSPGYESIDLYADNTKDDTDTDTRMIEAVAYESVSEYVSLGSSTYSFELKRSGVSGTLRTLAGQQLTDDSHATYVAYGSTGNFNVVAVGEDVEAPDAGEAYVQVLNVAEGVGELDIYFTDAEVSLENVSPQFAAVEASASATIDSGSYRLRITGNDDKDDLRLDVPQVELSSGQVLTFIITATSGGVLVNALLLPQQGALSFHRNTKARVRGAVGVANGTMTTIRVGGVTLLSNATTGAIGSSYAQVDAGSVAVNIGIDGTAVPAPNATLLAGGDYTLLAWDDAAGTHTSLLTDDNRLPTGNGETKLRIVNGMSGFGGPINLAIDYSPIAEGVALGQASPFAEVDAGSDYQLDVTSTMSAINLLTKPDVTLQGSGVYTLFMAGGQSGQHTSGILRKDR